MLNRHELNSLLKGSNYYGFWGVLPLFWHRGRKTQFLVNLNCPLNLKGKAFKSKSITSRGPWWHPFTPGLFYQTLSFSYILASPGLQISMQLLWESSLPLYLKFLTSILWHLCPGHSFWSISHSATLSSPIPLRAPQILGTSQDQGGRSSKPCSPWAPEDKDSSLWISFQHSHQCGCKQMGSMI